jgi:hypothetical protein
MLQGRVERSLIDDQQSSDCSSIARAAPCPCWEAFAIRVLIDHGTMKPSMLVPIDARRMEVTRTTAIPDGC